MVFSKQKMKKGFTLVEIVMTVVIAAVVLVPTSIVVVESVRNTFLPEHLTRASSLLNGEIDRVTSLRFADVVAQGPTNYSGNFSDYAYQVSFYYVNGSNLNTQVAGPTDYKRVTISVLHPSFTNISGVTLVTNN